MIPRNDRIDSTLTLDGYTPTLDRLERRIADFPTLGDALDYAAGGNRGVERNPEAGESVLSRCLASGGRESAVPNRFRTAG